MGYKTFKDVFADNKNNWWTGKDDSGWCDIVDGKYIIEHYKETDDYSVWRNLPLVESKAFSFEASFTFLSGYTKNGFGFLWGQKSNVGNKEKYSGFHYFVISASGKFIIRSFNPSTKKAEPIKDWTDSTFIKPGENSTNILKIMRFDEEIDNQLYFLINGQLAFQTNYLPMSGYEAGFIVFQNMKIAIKFFEANYYYDQIMITK